MGAFVTRTWIVAGAVILLLILLLVPANGWITGWVEGDGFRQMLDREISKGMKFDGHFARLHRVGLLGLQTDSFHGKNGQKTIVSMDAQGVTGWFNPLGVVLRHWELHAIHLDSGTVWLQQTEATPGAPKVAPPIPPTAFFWPYRVELEDVSCDDAKVLFKLRGQESGIYDTYLDITPNGRDFEYDARGGTFRTPASPELNVEHIHLLIRRPRLYCETLNLCAEPERLHPQLLITGDAGLQDDRSINLKAELKSLPVAPWLPESIRPNVSGAASGHFDYSSTGTGMETAEAHGSVDVASAVLRDLKLVKDYVKITASPDPGDLHLQTCRTDVRYEKGAITLENLAVECPGVFTVSGTATISKDGALSGALQLGLTDPYLKWLPQAKTVIFSKANGPYNFTTVHLSGTMQKPKQDLSPRVLKLLAKSPGTEIKLFFRAL
jgi:hypothetical protein